ncbi:GHKL domain-containing protein [Anaerocolumna sp. AGMB13025]|uniref:sensor histidine kinase n=1 Tax=Anaerocolumna sp. AGMB13025 TaxID=3039116 RepID=UPI00241E0091|nr:sensor histidine kinase [Anaerocolumna sp. AGMB13025]WFR56515.1 GHKL domain-containing protein [Anaerocolumna sp. AGMB13025]
MIGLIQAYFFTLVESILLYWMVNSLLTCKASGSKKAVFLIGAVLLDSLFVQFCPVNLIFLRLILFVALPVIIVNFFYRDSLWKKIFLILVNNYILLISDILAGNLSSLLNGTSLERLISETSYANFYFSILSKVIALLLIWSFLWFFHKTKPEISSKYWLVMDSMISFFIIVINFFLMSNHTLQSHIPYYSEKILVISLCFLLMTVMVVYLFGEICGFYQKAQQKHNLDLQNRMLEEELARQEMAVSDLKKIKHDLHNNLANISLLLQDNQIEESLEYINSITSVLEPAKAVVNSGNKYIDAILNYELSVCRKHQINTAFQIDSIPPLSMSPTDLSAILSNMLNNAIESNLSIKEPERYISLKLFCYKNYVTFVCKNPYNHILRGFGQSLRTSKKDRSNHGYGLKLIKYAADKCGGTFKYSYQDNTFTSIVMLPVKTQESPLQNKVYHSAANNYH